MTSFLRAVPPFVTSHTFYASWVWCEMFKVLKELPYYYNGIFGQFMTMWKKQIIASTIRIQKEKWG